MKLTQWLSTSHSIPPIDKKNFVNVQIDAIGVGLAGALSPFLPVFLTRLGASAFQVGLLSSMPAITGLILAIPSGQFLQTRKNIIPWFSFARLGVILCYALTGLSAFIIPPSYLPNAILIIWALATLPQIVLSITFSVVMNAVAGPTGRFELMTRRWSILGITTSIAVLLVGALLDRVSFPLNYQISFITLSIGGLVSYYFSSRILLPPTNAVDLPHAHNIFTQYRQYYEQVRREKPFLSFLFKRFVFLTGSALSAPLFPLYFVREIHASDAWIAAINTAQTAILIIGYFFWSRMSRKRGGRVVLLWTTLGLSLYPFLTALTHQPWQIAVYAGVAGIFQAGLDLIFFDELMRTVPPELSATFVSFAQAVQYISAIFAPIIGTALADQFGIGFGLIISAGLRLLGFFLFLFDQPKRIALKTHEAD